MKIKPFEINGKQCVALVRKLTELECFRLMGVDDEDARKMIASVSRSACYKLAGNSIVAGGNNTDTKGNVDGVLLQHIPKGIRGTRKRKRTTIII